MGKGCGRRGYLGGKKKMRETYMWGPIVLRVKYRGRASWKKINSSKFEKLKLIRKFGDCMGEAIYGSQV